MEREGGRRRRPRNSGPPVRFFFTRSQEGEMHVSHTSMEPLENRLLFALFTDSTPPIAPDGETLEVSDFFHVTHRGTLVVKGTDGNDTIRVTAGRNSVGLRFGADDAIEFSLSRSQFRRMRIEAGGGHDDVAVSGQLGKTLTINGGSGSDRLSGGIGAETINGGGGNDRIFAGAAGGDGRTVDVSDFDPVLGDTVTVDETDDGGSLLSGGRGNDTITGSSGQDTIRGDAGRDVLRVERPPTGVVFEPDGP